MAKKNYLFSTTRQWNPGDEFILFGLMNLLKDAGHDFNPIIYNRNPDIRENYTALNFLKKFEPDFKGKGIINSFFKIGFKDNSFKNYTSPNIIDKVYFAGSPEWQTYRLEELYKLIEKSNIPVEFHGIGAWANFSHKSMRPIVDRVLKKAKKITVRDEYTHTVMKDFYNSEYLSCPALFSASATKSIKSVNSIALIFSTYKTLHGNRVLESTYKKMILFYKEFIKMNLDKKIKFVCHYIDEIEDCIMQFPDIEIEYSYDARDYEKIYNQFDFVLGARVHGVGIAASQLIPGILFSHDARGGTGKGFGSEVISINDINSKNISEKIQSKDYLFERVEKIKEIKENSFKKYMEILR